jgi:outer membrane protein TolC
LPNPELALGWSFIENVTRSFVTSGFEVGINWAPPRPGERGVKIARAEARIEEVRAQIASEEWRLAADVRKAYVTFLAAGRRRDLVEASLALQRRARSVLGERLRLGDASRLEANLLELDLADRLREEIAIANEYERAQRALNRLLGFPPQLPVALQDGAGALAVRPVDLAPRALETAMIDRRPDLAAARQEYEQDERSLQLAYIQRIPWFRFGPMYQRDGEPGAGNFNRFGLAFTFDLPLANLNEGEIARLEAVRDKRREAFVAKVHLARAEVNEALRALRAQERTVRLYDDTIRPAVAETAALSDAAVRLGDVNVLQFVAAQDKVLRFQHDFVDTQREYWLALFELERAIGARLDDVAGKEE